jgi:hypothetical protein
MAKRQAPKRKRRPKQPPAGPLPRKRDIVVGRHAVDRYVERYRPGMAFDAARREIIAAISTSSRSRLYRKRPDWLAQTKELKHSIGTLAYLVIDDRLAFPVQMHDGRPTTRTCLVAPGTERRPAGSDDAPSS